MLCEARLNDHVFSLTKLRRHQDNYHVPNIDPGQPEFLLNICGPLVTADTQDTNCHTHSACAKIQDQFRGLGKAVSSPFVSNEGEVVIEYTDGQVNTLFSLVDS